MALDNYGALKESITKWLWRTGDKDTEQFAPDLVTLAEAHFSRKLRVREMEAVATLPVVDGVATLPTGFRAVKSVRETGADHSRITPKPIDELERYEDLSAGLLQFYDLVGDEIHFWPRAATTVRLRYVKTLDALGDTNASNWLLLKHPDLYLYQSLACGEAFNMNDQRVAMWKAKAQMAMAEVSDEDIHENIDAIAPTPSVGVAV